jgi:hypothetical protein
MLRHWLNPQRNLALNGDRYFLDSKTLVKKKASKVKLESKYEEKKFIKRISILLKKGILSQSILLLFLTFRRNFVPKKENAEMGWQSSTRGL